MGNESRQYGFPSTAWQNAADRNAGITPEVFDEKYVPSRRRLDSGIQGDGQINYILEHTGRMFFFKTEIQDNTQWLVIESTQGSGVSDSDKLCVYFTGSEDKLRAIAFQIWEDYKKRHDKKDIPVLNRQKGIKPL